MSEEFDFDEVAPWIVTIITLIGVALRVLILAVKGMAVDETVNVWLASHSLQDILTWVSHLNQQPPLYYYLLHGWINLRGTDAYPMRFFSVLFSAGAIPFIYWTGKRMAGPNAGIAAAILMAVSPFNIYTAQQVDMYSLLTFNAAVATWALVNLLSDPRANQRIGVQFRETWRAWRQPRSLELKANSPSDDLYTVHKDNFLRRWVAQHTWLPLRSIETDLSWILFIIFSALTLLTHNAGILFFLAANVFTIGLAFYQKLKKSAVSPAFQAPGMGNWVISQAVVLVLAIPWFTSISQRAAVLAQRNPATRPDWNAVIAVVKSLVYSTEVLPTAILTIIWILFAAILIAGILFYRKKISQGLFLIVLFALPLLSELIISIWIPCLSAETLSWLTIPVVLLIASGVGLIKNRYATVVVLGIFCSIQFFSVVDYIHFYQKDNWNSAAREVAGHAEAGDLVLFDSNLGMIPFDYYFEPYAEYYDIQVEEKGLPQDLIEGGVVEPEMTAADTEALSKLIQGHDRVWLVSSNTAYTDPQGLAAQTLAEQMNLSEQDYFYGGQVMLFTAK